MKILVIGDFHGKFPEKLRNRIKRKKPDLVISLGDFFPFGLKKEFFKHSFDKDVPLWKFIGKKKFKETTIKDRKKGENILRQLNKLSIPVLTVLGNYDHPADDVFDLKKPKKENYWKWEQENKKDCKKKIENFKNIHGIDYKDFKFKGILFIGARGHSFPGKVKSEAYKKHRAILGRLFNKNKKEKIIFVTHIAPYETKLDKIRDKDASKKVRGKHFGSKMFKRIINKWQPVLHLSGHFHENQGKDKIKNTLLINPGPAYENKGAIIDFDENKGKVKKVEFFR